MRVTLVLLAVMFFAVTGAARGQSANDVGTTPQATYQPRVPTTPLTSGSDSFTGAETTMTQRFYRPGAPTTACSTIGSGTYQYLTVPFVTDSSGTLSATFDTASCGVNIYVTFHNTSFNPTNICTNFVWSYGSSLPFSSSFPVTKNQSMLMVVSAVPNFVTCGPFTYSLSGTAVAPTFTDDPLQDGVTRIKAVHVVELRQAIASLRARYGLAVFPWTDPALSAGTQVKAVHVSELRLALANVYTAARRSEPTYTNATITPRSTTVNGVDVGELRSAVLAIW